MRDVGRHPKTELMTLSEVADVSGHIGDFKIKVRKKARYVVEKDCTACGECATVCPVAVPSETQIGLGTRRAISIPFPQAIPSAYLINPDD